MLKEDCRDATWYMVKHLLARAKQYQWTRRSNNFSLVLEAGVTLSVFDSRYRHRDAQTVHSHSADFTSRIVAGIMRHSRYAEADKDAPGAILCKQVRFDESGSLVADAPSEVFLVEGPQEYYGAGESYSMLRPEMHRASPEDGTVTIRIRDYKSPSTGVRVCWLPGSGPKKVDGNSEVVKIAPYAPMPAELDDVVGNALQTWF